MRLVLILMLTFYWSLVRATPCMYPHRMYHVLTAARSSTCIYAIPVRNTTTRVAGSFTACNATRYYRYQDNIPEVVITVIGYRFLPVNARQK